MSQNQQKYKELSPDEEDLYQEIRDAYLAGDITRQERDYEFSKIGLVEYSETPSWSELLKEWLVIFKWVGIGVFAIWILFKIF